MLNHLFQSIGQFFFPSTCIYCHSILSLGENHFCQSCNQLLELIDPVDRCPYCFSHDCIPESRICYQCKKNPPFFNRIAAAFDYTGPAAVLIKRMKYGNQPYLSTGAGAFMAMQFLRLEWPIPHYIVPVPITLSRWLSRGYNQSQLLAEEISKVLKVPLLNALKRRLGDYSQAGLSREQRQTMGTLTIEMRRSVNLHDKTILVVDDVLTTGTTLRSCGEALQQQCPKELYAMTFCRSIFS